MARVLITPFRCPKLHPLLSNQLILLLFKLTYQFSLGSMEVLLLDILSLCYVYRCLSLLSYALVSFASRLKHVQKSFGLVLEVEPLMRRIILIIILHHFTGLSSLY
uniref:Hedgehog receptor, putative n=1 Tax=Arundo donax TaxID=35708 RepID=A0A0A9VH36_ARUDO